MSKTLKQFIAENTTEQVTEMNVKDIVKRTAKSIKRGIQGWDKNLHNPDTVRTATDTLDNDARERVLATKASKGSPLEFQQRLIKRDARRVRAESVTESEKPFVKVVLDEPRGTSYTVVASTFNHPLGKVGTKLSDAGMDKLVMLHHNNEIHLENASDKGSGPGSKSRKARRKLN